MSERASERADDACLVHAARAVRPPTDDAGGGSTVASPPVPVRLFGLRFRRCGGRRGRGGQCVPRASGSRSRCRALDTRAPRVVCARPRRHAALDRAEKIVRRISDPTQPGGVYVVGRSAPAETVLAVNDGSWGIFVSISVGEEKLWSWENTSAGCSPDPFSILFLIFVCFCQTFSILTRSILYT